MLQGISVRSVRGITGEGTEVLFFWSRSPASGAGWGWQWLHSKRWRVGEGQREKGFGGEEGICVWRRSQRAPNGAIPRKGGRRSDRQRRWPWSPEPGQSVSALVRLEKVPCGKGGDEGIKARSILDPCWCWMHLRKPGKLFHHLCWKKTAERSRFVSELIC